jgi:hypothetical protein
MLARSPVSVVHKMTQLTYKGREAHFAKTGGKWLGRGALLDGYQMRYIYFLDPAARIRLVPKEIPFAEIERRDAGMHAFQMVTGREKKSRKALRLPAEGRVHGKVPSALRSVLRCVQRSFCKRLQM